VSICAKNLYPTLRFARCRWKNDEVAIGEKPTQNEEFCPLSLVVTPDLGHPLKIARPLTPNLRTKVR